MRGQNAGIRTTLERIRAAVGHQILTQACSPRSKRPGDPQQREFWQRLAFQETELRRLLRQLVGRQTSLEHERSLLWRIPREQRYSARQSIDDRETVNLDLVELAELTLRELLGFSGDVATMKVGDWESLGEQVIEFADKIDKQLIHTVVHQIQEGPAFTTANPLPGFGLDHLAPLVGLLIALIASKRRKRPGDAA